MVQTAEHGQAYAYYKAKYGIEAARGYLKEFIVKGSSHKKQCHSGVINSRLCLKAIAPAEPFNRINYGIHGDKMKMLLLPYKFHRT